MLTETVISGLIISRLMAHLPTKMQGNVIPPPAKLESITADVIKTKYPDGLFVAGFSESDGTERFTETQIYAIDCIGLGDDRADRLSRFCKIVMIGWQIPGASRFEFHDDKKIAQEAGIIVRKLNFRCNLASPPLSDAAITANILSLEL